MVDMVDTVEDVWLSDFGAGLAFPFGEGVFGVLLGCAKLRCFSHSRSYTYPVTGSANPRSRCLCDELLFVLLLLLLLLLLPLPLPPVPATGGETISDRGEQGLDRPPSSSLLFMGTDA